MADDAPKADKQPRQPNVKPPDDSSDPADVFARNKPPESRADPIETEQLAASVKPKKKRVRDPSVSANQETPKETIIDEGMNIEGAAGEVLEMLDGLFTVAAVLRGYDQVQVMDPKTNEAKPAMQLIQEKQQVAKPRAERALVRYMKSIGVNGISPGMGVGIAMFGMYAAPIMGMELSLAMARRAAKQGAK